MKKLDESPTRREVLLGSAAGISSQFLAESMPAVAEPVDSDLIVKPYLQLGDHFSIQEEETVEVLWHANDRDDDFSVMWKPHGETGWQKTPQPSFRRVAPIFEHPPRLWVISEEEATRQEIEGRRLPEHTLTVDPISPHRVYRTSISPLRPGTLFDYHLLLNGKEIFTSSGKARSGPDQRCLCVICGDIGSNTPAQRRVAHLVDTYNPDMIAIPGDIVYFSGRIWEYRSYFYPIQNADISSPETGAPLLRKRMTFPGLGQHDSGGDHPDSFGYYLYWNTPRNGPAISFDNPNAAPLPLNTKAGTAIFEAIGKDYPKRANYSFEYGPALWTVLDTNEYVDWNDATMRDWLRTTLKSAKPGLWKFVLCYLPPFHSGKNYNWQKMRIVADIFQEERVDIVFSGFHHSYQRTFPMRFHRDASVLGTVTIGDTVLPGTFTLDKRFDGKNITKPDGIIYLVTGGGGWVMLNPEQTDRPETWQPYTACYKAKDHCFTLLDMDINRLSFRQVSEHNTELDRFTITRV